MAYAGQTITYCCIGTHHQNVIAEAHIEYLTLAEWTMLLRAKRHWPEAITTMLFPYAIKAAGARHNRFHMNNNGLSPLELFSGVETTFDIKLNHTWCCPAYILDTKLQDRSGGILKWEPISRLGICLGHSPVHSGSAAMVLNPRTGTCPPSIIFLTTILQLSLV